MIDATPRINLRTYRGTLPLLKTMPTTKTASCLCLQNKRGRQQHSFFATIELMKTLLRNDNAISLFVSHRSKNMTRSSTSCKKAIEYWSATTTVEGSAVQESCHFLVWQTWLPRVSIAYKSAVVLKHYLVFGMQGYDSSTQYTLIQVWACKILLREWFVAQDAVAQMLLASKVPISKYS